MTCHFFFPLVFNHLSVFPLLLVFKPALACQKSGRKICWGRGTCAHQRSSLLAHWRSERRIRWGRGTCAHTHQSSDQVLALQRMTSALHRQLQNQLRTQHLCPPGTSQQLNPPGSPHPPGTFQLNLPCSLIRPSRGSKWTPLTSPARGPSRLLSPLLRGGPGGLHSPVLRGGAGELLSLLSS